MEKTVVKTGKTVEEAIESALSELGVAKEDAKIEIVNELPADSSVSVQRKQKSRLLLMLPKKKRKLFTTVTMRALRVTLLQRQRMQL